MPERASEARYFQILDTAPDAMVVVGQDEKIVFVNVQTEKLFGYARAELLGQGLDTLLPERFRSTHHGHVARYFKSPGVRSMGSGLELFGRRVDGTELAIEVSLSPVQMAEGVLVSAAIRDITERKRLAASGRINAERLASAVESIQDAFALFDAEWNLVLCNSVYRSLLDKALPGGALVGRSYEELTAATADVVGFEKQEERVAFLAQHLAERGEPGGAIDVRTRDGRRLRITSRRTLEGGIVQTIWDLTDDVQREEDLREARAAAEAGSAAKSEFLSSMSHELRTPLNAILGFAQLLQRDKKEPLSPRHHERVDQILKGGEHLLRLIDDILDLSRIEAGGVSISTEPVSVGDVLDEVRRTLGPMATRNGIVIEVQADPVMVAADRTRFAQILMNFGSNAIKYNRPNGKLIFSVTAAAADRVRVTVSDTGMGIAEEKHDKIFQPFQRAGQEMGPIEGTGIGLVITKRLAELMSGSVGFRSVAGKGSDFWIDLPAHEAKAPIAHAPAVSESRTAREPHEARHLVLYVEDNPANVTFMKDLVSTFDFIDLVAAPTAEMGVELARARGPEVIIMDINLPGMSGLDALRVLREDEGTKHIPVIALTAAASDRDKQRGLAAGFYEYLTKPVKVDELVNALEALLTKKP
jgi:PAS domain S-box-containing protein